MTIQRIAKIIVLKFFILNAMVVHGQKSIRFRNFTDAIIYTDTLDIIDENHLVLINKMAISEENVPLLKKSFQKANDEKAKARVAFFLGVNLFRKSQSEALSYFYYAYNSKKYLKKDEFFAVINYMIEINNVNGFFLESIELIKERLEFSLQENDNFNSYSAYVELGVLYRNIRNFDKAKFNFEKALYYAKKDKDAGYPFWLYIHYARMYFMMSDYKNANKYALLAYKTDATVKSFKNINLDTALYELANANRNYNKELSEKYVQQLIKLQETISFSKSYILPSAYFLLGNLYEEKENGQAAIECYQKGFLLGKEINTEEGTTDNAKKIIASQILYYSLKKQASDYLYQKSSDYTKRRNHTEKFRTKYVTLQKTEQLYKKEEQKRKMYIFLAISSAVFAIILTIKWLLNRLNITRTQKYNEQLKQSKLKLVTTNETLKKKRKDLEHFTLQLQKDLQHSDYFIRDKTEYITDSNGFEVVRKETKSIINQSVLLKKFANYIDNRNESLKNIKSTREKIDLHELFEQCKESLRNSIVLIDPVFLIDFQNIKFPGNQLQLFQLLKNLIENALKYSASERTPNIELKAKKKGKKLTISVKDNGIGIPKEKQREIFDLFAQSRSIDVSKGMGIGLNVCKKIVGDYDGNIIVKSIEGRGTTFIVTLYES